MSRVLVIDDDTKICLFFTELLKDMGLEFKTANTLGEARKEIAARSFDLVLLDLDLPDGNGLGFMPELTALPDPPEVIIVTGTGDAGGAELAFKYNAWDYVQKPFLLNEVTLPITRALEYRKEKQTESHPVPLVRKDIIGASPVLEKCLEEVAKAAATDVSVLITGETGTGKELFARAVHDNSPRAGRPFVAVDCGALPDTLVESTLFGHAKGAFTGAGKDQEGLITRADRGTLMLDEVGDLPLPAQRSLLRTLQERTVRPVGSTREIPVDIRLIAATHLNLDELVTRDLFRKDLLYRIRTMTITLPPLRERGDDIEEIALKKIHELAARYNMPPKALSRSFLDALAAHPWPGNVRELVNLLEYVLASAGADPTIFPKHLPPEYRVAGLKFNDSSRETDPAVPDALDPDLPLPTLSTYRDRAEKTYLKELLNRSKGDRKAACHTSGISQSRLYGLLAKHGIPGFGSSE
ncbi:MAG: sigma-54-dependent Fis family transcriptional regulator [Desulfobacter sp.]|nr:MAG: sigma-54-dependent Fis family transcriptional regulator [Desulfobacter sp.]